MDNSRRYGDGVGLKRLKARLSIADSPASPSAAPAAAARTVGTSSQHRAFVILAMAAVYHGPRRFYRGGPSTTFPDPVERDFPPMPHEGFKPPHRARAWRSRTHLRHNHSGTKPSRPNEQSINRHQIGIPRTAPQTSA